MSPGPVPASRSRGCRGCLAWAIPWAVHRRTCWFVARVGTREESGVLKGADAVFGRALLSSRP